MPRAVAAAAPANPSAQNPPELRVSEVLRVEIAPDLRAELLLLVPDHE